MPAASVSDRSWFRVSAALAILPALPVQSAPARQEPDDQALLFTSFRGNGEDGLHLAWSQDGYAWKALSKDQPFLRSSVGGGLMRDPCLAQGPDGTFHLVWTTAWDKHGIGYANSRDLTHWSEPRLLDVMAHEPLARNVWAPEIFHDSQENRWLILWSSTISGRFQETAQGGDEGYNHRMYATTTTDFVTLAPTQLFFDPGHNVIDGTIVRDGNLFRLFYKDETLSPPAKNLHMATADHPIGPYRDRTPPITGGDWAEGPSAIKLGDRWFLYFDRYRRHRYGLITSRDLRTWQDESDRVQFPDDFRHGTVVRVDRSLIDRLQKGP